MQKHTLVRTLLLLCAFTAHAQKEDYIWTLGYLPNVPEEKFGGTMFNFHNQDELVSYYETPLGFVPVAVISTPDGSLRAYSSGCNIGDWTHKIMENGDSINAGIIADQYCGKVGYPSGNGVLMLYAPSNDFQYYMLHFRIGITNFFLRSDFLQTRFTFNEEHPEGVVTEKNVLFLQDTFSDHLTAVRHGNGRDWWVVAHKDRGNGVFVFRLGPEGIAEVKTQQLGPLWSSASWAGQSVFSPDGRRYARAAPANTLTVMDFDRCAGTFSNPRWAPMPDTQVYACGVAFSPNSRYLYLSTGLQLHQYDMEAPELEAGRVFIDEYDGFMAPFSTTFFQMRLAPNNRIYMTATNGVNYMHTIHQPDQAGTACDFRQHDLELPTYVTQGIPNVPFFRLYDMAGSPCDTLGINGPVVSVHVSGAGGAEGMQVLPNPASEAAMVVFGGPFTGEVSVFDLAGRLAGRYVLRDAASLSLPVADWQPGVYVLRVGDARGGGVRVLKMIVVR